MNYKDITDEINVRFLHTRCPRGGRLVMYHKGRTIGVLKSSGWDLLPLYLTIYHPHPIVGSDDSWFTVLIEIMKGG